MQASSDQRAQHQTAKVHSLQARIFAWLVAAVLGVTGIALMPVSFGSCGYLGWLPSIMGLFLLGFALWVGLAQTLAQSSLGLLLFLAVVILMPDLVRARISCNEMQTIADLRNVLAAEAAYRTANAGYFDGRLQCLERPTDCIPNYGADKSAFLAKEVVLPTRFGYMRSLQPGPTPDPLPPTASRSSVTSFAVVMVPVAPGKSGLRGFCGDSTGVICFSTNGAAPAMQPDGTCSEKCIALQ